MLQHISEFPFLLRQNKYPISWIYHILLTYSSVGGHLGITHKRQTFVSNAALNIGVQISVQFPAFSSLGCISRSVIAESYGNSMLSLEEPVSGLHGTCTTSHPHRQHTHTYTPSSPAALTSYFVTVSLPNQLLLPCLGRDGMRWYEEKRLSGQINLALRSFSLGNSKTTVLSFQ